jgi:thiamine-monophosphate kinase
MVTGALGGSILGRHVHFTPRLAEVRRVLELVTPHALIDVSDGFAADLHHLLEASGVGAVIEAAAIPIHPDAHRMSDQQTPLRHALSDGEDFELIMAVAPDAAAKLLKVWDHLTPLTLVGQITAEKTVLLRQSDGHIEPLPAWGWTHDLSSP